MSERKLIVVIGGTGAQGIPVVEAISASPNYSALVLTRNPESTRAKALAALPNVELIQGTQDSQKDLHAAFSRKPRKNELFYGIRTYEIARHHGVKHYIWANTDYALRKAGWDEKYHWGHNDAKGRIADLILSHNQKDGTMISSCLTTGPYMDMLFDGMFKPQQQEDGSFVWANPASDGKIPLIALDDVGHYSLWLFNNPTEAAGLDLEVATDQVSLQDIARTFTHITGIHSKHQYVPLEEYLPLAEPYPNAYANWAFDPSAPRDESVMTWRENFSAWWRYWSEGKGATRDMEFLDKIHPNRIKNLEDWMRRVGYDGKPRSVLKGIEDMQGKVAWRK